MSKLLQLYRGGYGEMITVLHRGGMPKWLQYYIGGERSLRTPKSDYVICAQPLRVKLLENKTSLGLSYITSETGGLKAAPSYAKSCTAAVSLSFHIYQYVFPFRLLCSSTTRHRTLGQGPCCPKQTQGQNLLWGVSWVKYHYGEGRCPPLF